MPGQHWIITYAACLSEGSVQAFAGLKLPQMKQVWSRLNQRSWAPGSEHSLSLPQERLQDPSCPDGLIPHAARRALERDCGAKALSSGWAFITPCHWSAQANSILLADPAQLQLAEDESRHLLESMQPYFSEDGIQLCYDEAGRWLAESDLFTRLPTAHPDRAVGRNLLRWLPSGDAGNAGRQLRRLQNEMQMLLYHHPVNDARSARGQPAVNSFWVSGTGPWDSVAGATPQPFAPRVVDALRGPALREDWAAWAGAWQQLDAGLFAELAERLKQREAITLSLCGERGSVTCELGPQPWWKGLGGIFNKKSEVFPNTDAYSKL